MRACLAWWYAEGAYGTMPAATDLVKRIERGELEPGPENVAHLEAGHTADTSQAARAVEKGERHA